MRKVFRRKENNNNYNNNDTIGRRERKFTPRLAAFLSYINIICVKWFERNA